VSFHVILMKGGMEKRKIDTNPTALPTKSIGVQLENIIKVLINRESMEALNSKIRGSESDIAKQTLNKGEKAGKFTSIVVDSKDYKWNRREKKWTNEKS